MPEHVQFADGSEAAGDWMYRFAVLGTFTIDGDRDEVLVRLFVGSPGHEVYCGSLTLMSPEWESLAAGLRQGLGESIRIEEGEAA
jgi:hypothetical protein